MKPIQLTAIIAMALAPSTFAQEELHQKVRELQNKAESAQAEGRVDEAEKLRNAARELAVRAKAAEAKREGSEKPQGEDFRAMLEKARHELEEAAKSGREDAAAEIKQRIAKLEIALRGDGEKREFAVKKPQGEDFRAMLEKARHELEDAAKAGKEDTAAEIKQRIAKLEIALRGDGKKREFAVKKPQPEATDGKRRLEHLGEAIEHLRAAGMKEPADNLSERARMLKQDLAAAHEGGEKHAGGARPDVERQLAEMREVMMNLQRQIKEMHKLLEELSRERK